MQADLPKAVCWSDGAVLILDQRRLPSEQVVLRCTDIETVFQAISTLQVRGAPAIGIAAAYGLITGLSDISFAELRSRGDYLISARPTAVNLAWAVRRMLKSCGPLNDTDAVSIPALLEEARSIHLEDIKACRAIGVHGYELIADCQNVLTHCNAGALAVSEFGTALAPIYTAYERGRRPHVYVDETRPLLQGARLTAYELGESGVDYTLICDNMAAYTMSLGRVDAVIVGADRVAANGDIANKIGTLNLAILCEYYKIPFYVACPVSTIDMETATGSEIEIELRAEHEVRQFAGQTTSPEQARVFNPAFDITPAKLVSALITEQGVFNTSALGTLQASRHG